MPDFDANNQRKLKRKRRLKIAFWTTAILLTAGAAFYWDVIDANMKFGALYEQARASGALVTAADLRRKYGAPDDQNAAPIITQTIGAYESDKKALDLAFKVLANTYSDRPEEPKQGDPTVQQAIAAWSPILDRLEATLDKPRCDFKYDWDQGAMVLFPQFSSMKTFTKALSAQGYVLASEGKTDAALRKFRLALHMGDLSGDSPTLIAALVRIANHAIAFRAMERAAVARTDDAPLRTGLRQLLASYTHIDARMALDGELYFNWHATNHLETTIDSSVDWMGEPNVNRELQMLARLPGVKTAWKTRSLEYCTRMRTALDATQGDPLLMAGALNEFDFVQPSNRISDKLNSILFPVFAEFGTAVVKEIAVREVLLATLDVLDARQATGAFPKDLPVDRRDLFGGKRLRYRTDGQTARVWSIGRDRTDSNGAARREDAKSDDLVGFIGPRP